MNPDTKTRKSPTPLKFSPEQLIEVFCTLYPGYTPMKDSLTASLETFGGFYYRIQVRYKDSGNHFQEVKLNKEGEVISGCATRSTAKAAGELFKAGMRT